MAVCPWALSSDIAFQLREGSRLFRDDPFHEVADGENPHHLFINHDRKMADATVRHDCHALIYCVLQRDEDDRARHDLLDPGFLRGSSFEHHSPGIITFRDDAHQLAVQEYE